MKQIITLILTITGAAFLASAAEPVKTETPPSTNSTPLSATKQSSGLDRADRAYGAQVGARLAQSGAINAKPKPSATKGFLQSINPLAPMKPAPTTPWISRASWNEIATTEHASSVASASAAETNRELRFKVTVWRD